MKKVLVTGGTGFIGVNTCIELERKGYEPVVLDRHMKRRTRSLVERILGDTRDRTAVDAAVGSCEGVIHLAGQLGTQETVRHPHTAAETNVLGSLNVLAAAHAYSVPMVYISVGNWWMNNPYSISKNCAERFALMYRKELDTRVTVVRALNAYGPGQKEQPVRKIIPTFIRACLNNEPISVYGSGAQIMDMVHVTDVAKILVAALERQPDKIVEAGTGRRTSVNDIAEMVIREVGQGSIDHVPMRPGEDEESVVVADTTTYGCLGLQPKDLIRLEDGLVETVDYYRQ
jgi:UDP-glucose 4-epimerase